MSIYEFCFQIKKNTSISFVEEESYKIRSLDTLQSVSDVEALNDCESEKTNSI